MTDVTWTTTDAQQIVSFESIQENLDQFRKAELRRVDTWISLSCKKENEISQSASAFCPVLESLCKLLGVHAAVLCALGFPLSNLAALYSDTSFIHFITLWCHLARVFKSIPCCLKGLILWLSFLFFLRNRKTFAMIVIHNWYSGWHPSKVHPRAAVVFGIWHPAVPDGIFSIMLSKYRRCCQNTFKG